MMEWKTFLWEDVLTIKNGKNQKKVVSPDGKYPIYGSGGIMGYANDFICVEGTTIIGRKGSINKPMYISEKFWNVDTAFGLCAKDEVLDKKFLYYFCLTYNFLKHNKATTLPSLTKADLLKIKIPLPPLETQRHIAQILDTADALRQKDQALLKQYDELAQSLFLEMFGDPVTNPKGWEKVELKPLVENLDSKRVPIKQSDRDLIKGEYPYYGATGIVSYINDFIFSGKYLLIAEDGKNLVNRKKPIAWIVEGKFWVNNHAHIVEFNGKINLEYLAMHLNKMDISNFITGIDQFKMNKNNLNKIPIMNPPISLQNQFAERIEAIEAQKAVAQRAAQQSEDLFQALLQRAFKGELNP